ncbi:MAG: Gldg family protein [Planctomycetota bacterium]|jgi:hypothetical protein
MSGAAPGHRRSLTWLNVTLTILLFAGIMVMANLASQKAFVRMDATSARRFDLSDQTEDRLKRLEEREVEVTIYVMPFAGFTVDERIPRVQERLRNLLQEYEERCSRVRVEWLERTGSVAYQTLSKVFGQNIRPHDTIYVTAGKSGGELRGMIVPVQGLYDSKAARGNVINFRAEEVLTNVINTLTMEEARVVCFTTGHMEADPGDARTEFGTGLIMRELQAREAVRLQPLNLLEAAGVPGNCSVLLIVSPRKHFHRAEIEKVQEYLERGGNLFYAPAFDFRSGLEPLLAAWGVRVGSHVVMDRGRMEGMVFIREFPQHEINEGVVEFSMFFPVLVEPPERKRERITTLPLMKTGPTAWEELQSFREQIPDRKWESPERKGALTVAVAVEAEVDDPADLKNPRARIVVWGSGPALGNRNVSWPGYMLPHYAGYITNTMRWLLGRADTISIPAVRDETKPFSPKPSDKNILLWLILAGFPALGVLIGIVVWIARRK